MWLHGTKKQATAPNDSKRTCRAQCSRVDTPASNTQALQGHCSCIHKQAIPRIGKTQLAEVLTGHCHVQLGLIRSILGDLAPVCPTLDISADIFNQWIGLVLGPNAGLKKQYSPYADDASFMIGALPPLEAACNPFST